MRTPPEVIETARLRMRRLVEADAETIFSVWAQDAEVTRYLAWRPHASIEDSAAHARRCETSWDNGSNFVWMIEELGSCTPVGSIAAHPDGHRVSLGYLVARSAWGRGYMTECVSALTAKLLSQPEVFRVSAFCDFENGASARVLEKAGFNYEGRLARWLLHPNMSDEPRDSLCFAVSKSAGPRDAF